MNINAKVAQGKTNEFLSSLDALHDILRTAPGFIRSALFQHVNDKSMFRIIQDWKSVEALLSYMGKNGLDAFIGALRILTDETEINCRLCNRETGSSSGLALNTPERMNMRLMTTYGT